MCLILKCFLKLEPFKAGNPSYNNFTKLATLEYGLLVITVIRVAGQLFCRLCEQLESWFQLIGEAHSSEAADLQKSVDPSQN